MPILPGERFIFVYCMHIEFIELRLVAIWLNCRKRSWRENYKMDLRSTIGFYHFQFVENSVQYFIGATSMHHMKSFKQEEGNEWLRESRNIWAGSDGRIWSQLEYFSCSMALVGARIWSDPTKALYTSPEGIANSSLHSLLASRCLVTQEYIRFRVCSFVT